MIGEDLSPHADREDASIILGSRSVATPVPFC